MGHGYVVSLAQVLDQINLCFGDTAAPVRLLDSTVSEQEVWYQQSNTLGSSEADGEPCNEQTHENTKLVSTSILPYTSWGMTLPVVGDHGTTLSTTVLKTGRDRFQEDRNVPIPADYVQGGAARHTAPTVISDAGIQQFKGHIQENESSWSNTTGAESYYTLEDRIFAARQLTQHPQAEPWKKDMGFIPKRQLNDIITEESVYQELIGHFAHSFDEATFREYAAHICREEKVIVRDGRVKLKSYKTVFALLVMFNKTSEILDILGEDVSDLDLPLVDIVEGNYGRHRIGRRSRIHKAHPPVHLWCFSKWSRVESESFLRYQWMMLAPFFRRSEYNDVQHYELHDSQILPWIDTAEDEYFEHHGGFSTVFPVRIHPEHHNFRDAEACQRGFAIKQLTHRNPVRFNREVKILQKFVGHNSHPYIVSLLATYEHCGKYHMIFYRAQGDLFRYWKAINPRPRFERDTVLWVANQCEGIADGLTQLHRHNSVDTSEEYDGESTLRSVQSQQINAQSRDIIQPATAFKSEELQGRSNLGKRKRAMDDIGVKLELRERDQWQFGRHGDLKPENILWFQGSEGTNGTLQIADFGQAELHEWQCKTRNRSEVADTMTYRAPECHFENGKFRQSSDVWSLGCLYLVFVAWTLGGAELVTEFAKARSAFDEYWGVSSDTFFEISLKEAGTYSVAVKSSVVQVMLMSQILVRSDNN
ncbi:kinase-like domain-containing protein [Apiospora marii]|uniref:kinase-like domain-containing protein n=1 Tax=Apiospora marii TaxID=335849 RepID=UPI003131940A